MRTTPSAVKSLRLVTPNKFCHLALRSDTVSASATPKSADFDHGNFVPLVMARFSVPCYTSDLSLCIFLSRQHISTIA